MSQATLFKQTIADYGLVTVSGNDAAKLLQGQLTCDIDLVSETKAQLGGYCNVQGRLHAIFYIFQYDSQYWLLMPKGIIEHFVATLSKYAVFFQTDISANDDYELLASSHNAESEHLQFAPEKRQLTIEGIHLTLQQNVDESPDENYQPLSAPAHLLDFEQIKSGIPMIFADTIEQFLPHSIGLAQSHGVNFEKGCYTGQEVVARMHYRGKLKTHPQRISIPSSEINSSNLGSAIMNNEGKKLGELIYQASNGNKTVGLISLNDKGLEETLYLNNSEVTLIND